MSIESEISEGLNMDEILKEFANATARKKVSLSKSVFCIVGYLQGRP